MYFCSSKVHILKNQHSKELHRKSTFQSGVVLNYKAATLDQRLIPLSSRPCATLRRLMSDLQRQAQMLFFRFFR